MKSRGFCCGACTPERRRAWMGLGERLLSRQHCDYMLVATPRNMSRAKPVPNTLTRVSTSLTRRLWGNMQKYLNTNIRALLSAGMRLGRIRQITVDYSAKHCGLFSSALTRASPTTTSQNRVTRTCESQVSVAQTQHFWCASHTSLSLRVYIHGLGGLSLFVDRVSQ